jgi:hypothetical protein
VAPKAREFSHRCKAREPGYQNECAALSFFTLITFLTALKNEKRETGSGGSAQFCVFQS